MSVYWMLTAGFGAGSSPSDLSSYPTSAGTVATLSVTRCWIYIILYVSMCRVVDDRLGLLPEECFCLVTATSPSSASSASD